MKFRRKRNILSKTKNFGETSKMEISTGDFEKNVKRLVRELDYPENDLRDVL